ncbi:hypothetical protein FB45DRAFT_321743 [Roridomyces roridus]|uniref:MYND-type domain-containing protein n=1 Tax=Roridomyces roridus TaxID=1738132 RepID=A0AAD7FC24_9AGAR|nr:hypothetical protein FB45DRAFT_321743 [Roridomyces roridus]
MSSSSAPKPSRSKTGNDTLCHEKTCVNSRLKGYTMSMCKKCRNTCYCSVACQRKDWPRHKEWCKHSAAVAALGDSAISEEFDKWQGEMGVLMLRDICVHLMHGHADPEYIESKLVLLKMRQREPRGTPLLNHLQIYRFESIELLDKSCLPALTGGSPDSLRLLAQYMREWREKTQLFTKEVCAAGWVVTEILAPGGSKRVMIRHSPVTLTMPMLQGPKAFRADEVIAMQINMGATSRDGLALVEENKEMTKWLSAHPDKLEETMGKLVDFMAKADDWQSSQTSA